MARSACYACCVFVECLPSPSPLPHHPTPLLPPALPQMDPCCIAAELVDFDAVLLSGVLEKIPSPKAPLGAL